VKNGCDHSLKAHERSFLEVENKASIGSTLERKSPRELVVKVYVWYAEIIALCKGKNPEGAPCIAVLEDASISRCKRNVKWAHFAGNSKIPCEGLSFEGQIP
jgi:hypothetical protein